MNREDYYRKYPEASFDSMMSKAAYILKEKYTLSIKISASIVRTSENQYESKAVLHTRQIDASLRHLGSFQFDDLETKRFIDLFKECMSDLDTEVLFQINPQPKIIFKPTTGTSPLPGILTIKVDMETIRACLLRSFEDIDVIFSHGVYGSHFEMELSCNLDWQAQKCIENAATVKLPDFASGYMEFMKQQWGKGVPPVDHVDRNGVVTDPTAFLKACKTFAENTEGMADEEQKLSEAKSIWEKNLQDGFGMPNTFSVRAQQENMKEDAEASRAVPPDMKIYPESDPTLASAQGMSPETSIFDQAVADVQKTANVEEAPTVEFDPSPTQEAIELEKLKNRKEMDDHMEYLRQQMQAQHLKEEAQKQVDVAEFQQEPQEIGIDTSAEAKREDEAFFAESNVEDLDPNDTLAKPQTSLSD